MRRRRGRISRYRRLRSRISAARAGVVASPPSAASMWRRKSTCWPRGTGLARRCSRHVAATGSAARSQVGTEVASHRHWNAAGDPSESRATRNAVGIDRLARAFRTGAGIGWHEQDPAVFEGTERFFRPGYTASLTTEWVPALPGVTDRLAAGGRVADVGCGHGAAAILLARAYPQASVRGYDFHDRSIQ